jgi:hypothetical protein
MRMEVTRLSLLLGKGPRRLCISRNRRVDLPSRHNCSESIGPGNNEGQEHIAIGKDGDGHGVRDLAGNEIPYFPYAELGDSGNRGAATVVSHSTTSTKIGRVTNDGI